MKDNPQKNIWIEAVGWYGALALLGAYCFISFSFLKSTDLSYQILNATGAIGIVIVSFYKRTYQPGVLNVIWAIVGLVAILKIIF